MNRTNIRSKLTEYDRDEDLEQLQREFMNSNEVSSASVSRKAPPSFGSSTKKPSLFAQRRAAAAVAAASTTHNTSEKKPGITIADLANDGSSSSAPMPGLESTSSTMPGLEDASTMPGLSSLNLHDEQGDTAISYEPVVDPNPEPHTPATKKMLDLTSMLGSILGEVTEHSVDNVTAPTLTAQHQGFPQPMHRSRFKRQHEQQQQNMNATTTSLPPPPSSSTVNLKSSSVLSEVNTDEQQQQHDYHSENDQRIAAMTEDEIQAAREEILGSLSQDSIDYLNKLKEKCTVNKTTTSANILQQQPQSRETAKDDDRGRRRVGDNKEDEDDLWVMKNKYFADVPLEGEKLAWMDDRFMAYVDNKDNNDDNAKDEDNDDVVDPVYRQLRFDLHGRVVDPNDYITRPRQQELHHHGDQPDQAGYTLAELFYLVRSQVPSQRALILNILTRILEHAKKGNDKQDKAIIQVFRRRDVAAAVYFRSALDDRHLVVTMSAIQSLLALVAVDRLDRNTGSSSALATFNTWLGHISQPLLAAPQETTKKWVNEMKSASSGGKDQTQDDDAGLAERDMVDGLIQMDILARLRYLMAVDSDVRVSDSTSMERMVTLLMCMAEIKGETVCEMMVASGVLDLALGWVDDQQQQHSMEMGSAPEHRLCVLRLMTAVIQGSKKVAMDMKDKLTLLTLPWLATTPVTHSDYQVQTESLKVLRLLACYGMVVPTLQDLQDTVMQWLAVAINSNKPTTSSAVDKTTKMDINDRAATVIGLLEVLLHAAADPHKTIPAHAINWHQPSSFQPLITALLGTTSSTATATTVAEKTTNEMLQGCCLGYLSAWTSYLDKFPPESMNTLQEIWDMMQEQRMDQDQKENAYVSSHWILRYMKLWLYFTKWDTNKTMTTPWITDNMTEQARVHWKSLAYLVQRAQAYDDFYGRMAYYLWHKITDGNKEKGLKTNDEVVVSDATMTMVANSLHGGVVETWLARALLRMCMLSCLDQNDNDQGLAAAVKERLEPFYMNQGNNDKPNDVRLSKELMELNGQGISTLCYPRQIGLGATSSVTAWLLSPVDEIYYWDKSRVTQQLLQAQPHDSTGNDSSQRQLQQENETLLATVTMVVISTLQAVRQLYLHRLDHNLLLVTLMKIFLIGDREGQSLMVDGAAAIRELFWDESLATEMDRWMDLVEDQDKDNNKISSSPLFITDSASLEQAWVTSSGYTRQAHVPFYQFYQAFLSQYASVSLGHRVYSRVLAFVAKKVSDQVDYRHLLCSDYQDILTTLKRQGYSLDLQATPPMEHKKNVV